LPPPPGDEDDDDEQAIAPATSETRANEAKEKEIERDMGRVH
jgi:hypothetical protein